jgi:hypothetical protein
MTTWGMKGCGSATLTMTIQWFGYAHHDGRKKRVLKNALIHANNIHNNLFLCIKC